MTRQPANAVATHRSVSVCTPAPLGLSALDMRRLPARPAQFRGPDFEEKFDHDTLVYDAFRMPDGRVALLGPPLLNLKTVFETLRITALPGGEDCRFTLREMDRHLRIVVDAPAAAHALSLAVSGKSLETVIQPGETDSFAGRRVLFTVSRNNQLTWIRDWVSYARDVHQADAVLLYDNASTLYGSGDLLDVLSGIEGIAVARVVEWPFRYGPQGLDAKRFWDSDFCQRGAWEHARWRFLARAKSAQNADVDELVVSRSGRSVFAAAEASPFGVVSYRGRWVMGTRETAMKADSDARRHLDYDTVLRAQPARRFGILPFDSASCAPKWTVVPAKCPAHAQWNVHSITGWLPSRMPSGDFSYRHFREISDNWKYNREDRQGFDPAIHERDEILLDLFAKVKW